jgi:hypothetical protein
MDSDEILDMPMDEIEAAEEEEIQKLWPSIIIRMLDKFGYQFKREQFDRFLEHATYFHKSDSVNYSVNYSKNCPFLVRLDDGYRGKCIDECIKFMFNKFDPTKKQMRVIIDCYNNDIHNKNEICLETLVKKGYVFSKGEKRVLLNNGIYKPFLIDEADIDVDIVLHIIASKSTYLKLDSLGKAVSFVLKYLEKVDAQTDECVDTQANAADTRTNTQVKSQVKSHVKSQVKPHNILEKFLGYVAENEQHILIEDTEQKLYKILIFVEELVAAINKYKLCRGTYKKLFGLYADMVIMFEKYMDCEGVDLVYIFTKSKKGYKLDLDDIRYICNNEDIDYKFTYELIEKGSIELTVDIISELVENYFWIFITSQKYDDYEESLKLIKFAEDMGTNIASDMLDNKILRKVCQYDTKTDCIEYLFKEYGMIPDNGCLNGCLTNIINFDDDDILMYILNKGITPDYGALEALINASDEKDLENSDGPDRPSDTDDSDDSKDEWFKKRLGLLIYYGLEVGKPEMKLLVENKVELEFLDGFDIEFDNEVYYWCFKQDFLPQSYYDKFVKSLGGHLVWFRWACSNSEISFEQIVEYLKKHPDLKPDRYCMENLYWGRENEQLDYFLDRGCKPTPSCLLGKRTAKNNRVLDILNEEMGITVEKMAEPFKDFKVE